MSVPTSQRAESSMQYIETARRLAKDVLAYTARIPKRHWQRLANPLFKHASEAYCHVQCANRIYIKSEADYDHRRGHLQDALGELDHVASMLDIAFDIQESPNENVYMELAEKIDKERKLIGGVMKRDQDARK